MPLKVKVLERKRADYHAAPWGLYEKLYLGGHELDTIKGQILSKNPMETDSAYAIRLNQFHCKNLAAAGALISRRRRSTHPLRATSGGLT